MAKSDRGRTFRVSASLGDVVEELGWSASCGDGGSKVELLGCWSSPVGQLLEHITHFFLGVVPPKAESHCTHALQLRFHYAVISFRAGRLFLRSNIFS